MILLADVALLAEALVKYDYAGKRLLACKVN